MHIYTQCVLCFIDNVPDASDRVDRVVILSTIMSSHSCVWEVVECMWGGGGGG